MMIFRALLDIPFQDIDQDNIGMAFDSGHTVNAFIVM